MSYIYDNKYQVRVKESTWENDPIKNILQYLLPNSTLDVKQLTLDHLLSISGALNGVQALLKNGTVVQLIIELTDDDEVCENALLILVNISSYENGASKLLKYNTIHEANVVELFISYIIDSGKSCADAACMILANITRQQSCLNVCLDTFVPHLESLLKAFANLNYNEKQYKLHHLALLFVNLSLSPRIRKWFIEPSLDAYPFIPLKKILPFCNYMESEICRSGTIGIVRNLSFDTSCHEFLLSENLDLLTYLLPPIMGNEEYSDDEIEKLPAAVQYYPEDKQRDSALEIRKEIIEILNKLCAKRHGREILRNNGVYYVLREYHRWEKQASMLLACENVIDILIQEEAEVGAEDLSSLEVPEDLIEKFKKMDEDYLNSE